MKAYQTIASAFTVLPEGDSLFSEMATTVRLEDEGAGLFVVIEQEGRDGQGKVAICQEEWPKLKIAVEAMILRCKEMNKRQCAEAKP